MNTTEMEIRSYKYSDLFMLKSVTQTRTHFGVFGGVWTLKLFFCQLPRKSSMSSPWWYQTISCFVTHFSTLHILYLKKCQRWPDFNQQIVPDDVPELNLFISKTSDSLLCSSWIRLYSPTTRYGAVFSITCFKVIAIFRDQCRLYLTIMLQDRYDLRL